jgi:hypothetical protein
MTWASRYRTESRETLTPVLSRKHTPPVLPPGAREIVLSRKHTPLDVHAHERGLGVARRRAARLPRCVAHVNVIAAWQ